MKRILGFVTIVLLALTASLAFAQTDTGEPNDPTVNPDANDCYEGGVFAGLCDTEAEWQAGWYLIHYRYGLINSFPNWAYWAFEKGLRGDICYIFTYSGNYPVLLTERFLASDDYYEFVAAILYYTEDVSEIAPCGLIF